MNQPASPLTPRMLSSPRKPLCVSGEPEEHGPVPGVLAGCGAAPHRNSACESEILAFLLFYEKRCQHHTWRGALHRPGHLVIRGSFFCALPHLRLELPCALAETGVWVPLASPQCLLRPQDIRHAAARARRAPSVAACPPGQVGSTALALCCASGAPLPTCCCSALIATTWAALPAAQKFLHR